MPMVRGRLFRGGRASVAIKFLIDSGAAMTLVPRTLVGSSLGDLSACPEQSLRARGADGSALRGVPLSAEISLLDGPALPVVRERVWIYGGPWALLGQTWLEKVGVHFQNFPASPRGRRFALYPCPWQAGAGDAR